jgi:hypothetical protein
MTSYLCVKKSVFICAQMWSILFWLTTFPFEPVPVSGYDVHYV